LSSRNWLTLMEYSAKYRVSISTLRRRIKASEMEFQFTDGKYLLKDTPISSGAEVVAPPISTQPQNQRQPIMNEDFIANLQSPLSLVTKPAPSTNVMAIVPSPIQENNVPRSIKTEEAVNPTVERLLSEIKKSYSTVLQEKEEHIRQLRSEISDLKTLVQVLEQQNGQLSKSSVSVSNDTFQGNDFDLDLEL
jgi:hypothetical protein